jgi:hypothetical protein
MAGLKGCTILCSRVGDLEGKIILDVDYYFEPLSLGVLKI